MTRPKSEKKRFSRTIECGNCGKRATQHRPGGRFCSPKCRQVAWWRKQFGVAKSEAAEQDAMPKPDGA